MQYFERISYTANPISMTRAELQDLARAGHEIGCHTHSHFDLARLDRQYWEAEIQGSRRELEDLIGRPVVHFAYPYGMRRFFTVPLRDVLPVDWIAIDCIGGARLPAQSADRRLQLAPDAMEFLTVA